MRRETKKKLLAWLLCICLALQLAPQIFAAEPQTQASAEESQVAQEAAPVGEDVEAPQASRAEENGQQSTILIQEEPGEAAEKPQEPVFGMDAFVIPQESVTCGFADVAASSWYYKAVAYCSSLGLVSGKTAEKFDPAANISTAESITLAVQVYRMYHGITTPIPATSTGSWYTPYETLARAYGILPAGVEVSNRAISRQEAAAVFYNMLPEAELAAINEIKDLPDVGKNNPYYKEILALYNAGVLAGTETVYGTFAPTRSIARCEFVQLLLALILPLERGEHTFSTYTGMAAFDMSRYDVTSTFADVAKTDWFYNAVAVQQTIGLISGVDETHFAPQGKVTLAQALSIAVRAYQKYHGVKDSYEPAAGQVWYAGFARLAVQYGIVSSSWSNYDQPLTRDRLAMIIYNTLPSKELTAINSIEAIPDMEASDQGYQEILALYNAGILCGNDKLGNFAPTTNVTRAEFAAMFTRLTDVTSRVKFTLETTYVGEKIIYGTSGAGQELAAYRYGSGKNVMVVGFAIHGYEDHFAKDGQELVFTAQSLQTILQKNMDVITKGDWTVYVLPCMNPDGLYNGYTNNGPGRCTTTYYTASGALSSSHGVDMNRSFPANFVVQTSARYYTGPAALSCKESRALAAFVRKVKGTGKNVCIDTHGWTQQIITSTGTSGLLYKTFHSAFGSNTYANCRGAAGYFTAYTASLGYDSCLFEFPGGVYSHNAFLSSGYSAKYISCIMTLLNKY